MRRGTPAAYEFGKWLEARRVDLGLSMRKVGTRIGAPASTVSQVEHGERALKEPKIPEWAKALEISEACFRHEWNAVQKRHPPIGPIVRLRGESLKAKELENHFTQLTGPERMQVLGYIDAIIANRTTPKEA